MELEARPGDSECFGYHRDYVAKVPDGNILETLSKQLAFVGDFVREIDDDQTDVIHEPYGWTIRQVIEHCADAERVFGYRALRFAAGDETELPGWDENKYAAADYGGASTLDELADEFCANRGANLALLARISPVAWDRFGTADGTRVSVRTLAWLMAGHWLHHQEILEQRLAGV